jgi:hypothetical protein
MANVSVNFKVLMEKHPTGTGVRGLVSGIPNYVNETCCVQMSYAFDHAGAPVEDYSNVKNPVAGRKVRAFNSGGRNYIFEVSDMRFYLDKRWGQAENYNGTKDKMIASIEGRTGVLAMGHRHIDLWVGENIHRPSLYRMDYLWSNESIKLRGVFFWEVTSEFGF